MSLVFWIVVLLIAGLLIWTRLLWRSAERQVPQAGKLCTVDGGVIHYIEAGPKDAQTLVLIHGLSGILQHFTYGMVEDLAQDFHIIAIDRPGCGYSTRARGELAALPKQAAMIGDCLDQIGVKDPVLVGHSLGGAVSLAMAVDRPDKIAGLALICPATQPQKEIPDVFKPLNVSSVMVRRLMGHLLAVPLGKLTIEKVLGAVFEPETRPDDFMVKGGAVLGLRPSTYIGASEDLIFAMHSAADVAARYETDLKTPGGILFGSADAVLSPQKHGAAMQTYGLGFEEISDRGHMLPITAPQECCDFVRRVVQTLA